MKLKILFLIILDYVKGSLVYTDILDIEIIGTRVYESRNKEIAHYDSDFDVLLEYRGGMREDDFFNLLHCDNLYIEGILVGINLMDIK